jgi:hypothetical protein
MRTVIVTVEHFEAMRTIQVPVSEWPDREMKTVSIELPETQRPSRLSFEEIQLCTRASSDCGSQALIQNDADACQSRHCWRWFLAALLAPHTKWTLSAVICRDEPSEHLECGRQFNQTRGEKGAFDV